MSPATPAGCPPCSAGGGGHQPKGCGRGRRTGRWRIWGPRGAHGARKLFEAPWAGGMGALGGQSRTSTNSGSPLKPKEANPTRPALPRHLGATSLFVEAPKKGGKVLFFLTTHHLDSYSFLTRSNFTWKEPPKHQMGAAPHPLCWSEKFPNSERLSKSGTRP